MKTAHLVGSFETDVSLAASWLRLNKAISSAGDYTKRDNVYLLRVRLLKTRKEVTELLSARFGRFVQLR
jgi:hypothetical protein